DLRPPPGQRELRLAERDADARGLMLGRVAEQLVHLRPEPLLLESEGAVDVRGAAAVPSGGLPAHDALLEHEHVGARAGEPPAGAQSGDATADDDHGGAGWGHRAAWPTGRWGRSPRTSAARTRGSSARGACRTRTGCAWTCRARTGSRAAVGPATRRG